MSRNFRPSTETELLRSCCHDEAIRETSSKVHALSVGTGWHANSAGSDLVSAVGTERRPWPNGVHVRLAQGYMLKALPVGSAAILALGVGIGRRVTSCVGSIAKRDLAIFCSAGSEFTALILEFWFSHALAFLLLLFQSLCHPPSIVQFLPDIEV